MIGMKFNLQRKGVLKVAGFGSSEAKWKKQGSCVNNEPISVLDTRSPSPSTSTSTLSSSLGGGGGGTAASLSTDNTAGLLAVSDNNNNNLQQQNWPVSMPPPESGSAAVTDSTCGGGGWKDEWASELQPIPSGLEVAAGIERFGLQLEDWESLLTDSGQDQSLFRWVASDFDDLKQLFQGGANPNEIEGNVNRGSTVGGPASAGGSTWNGPATLTPVVSCGGSGSSSSNAINGKLCSSVGLNANSDTNPQIPIFSSSPNNPYFPSGVICQQPQIETPEEKPQILNPPLFMNQQLSQLTPNPNQNFCPPPSLYSQQDPVLLLQPPPKRQNLAVPDPLSQNPKLPFLDPGHEFLLRKQHQPTPLVLAQQTQNLHYNPHHLQQRPLMVPKQEQQQVIYDQLFKASELILAGNFSHAQGILARLNHQLSPPLPPKAKLPFQRAAFYFKEALQLPLLGLLPLRTTPTPFDGMCKIGAYKSLSEISPIVEFMNFTSNQALLEALGDAEHVHVVDFDIGFGAQWASFMQELPGRIRGSTPSFKITAFASPSTHHPIELGLMHENLTQFATEIGISFELEVVNFDAFDPTSYLRPPLRSSEKEAVVVNFPIWACSSRLSALPTLLRFVKQLSPKVIVSLERGCERADLPFSHHLLHALQYYETLLDSINAANATPETMNKIEKFHVQPRIESIVLGRILAPDHMPHWKALFASAGFSPVAFSNFTETQAECVSKRSQVRGFHVEKRQGSLVLYWQRRELMLASAWRC